MNKQELMAREYGGIPLEVCQAAYDTVKKMKYKFCYFGTSDQNFLDWMTLAGVGTMTARERLDFAFITADSENPLNHAPHIKRAGQIAFYGISPAPLRAYFNHPSSWEHWMTIELALGEGLFIAKRI